MPVDLLEGCRETLEQRVRVVGEALLDEGLQRRRVAVLRAPESGHLLHAALGAGAGGLAVLLDQRGDERGLVDRFFLNGRGRLFGGGSRTGATFA